MPLSERKPRVYKYYPKKCDRTCPVCLNSYHVPSLVEKCLARHSKSMDLDKESDCPLCKEKVNNKRLMTKHFFDNHEGQTCCPQCLLVMPLEKLRLRRHILKNHHSAGERVICPECGKSFSDIYPLNRHLKQHSESICEQCGQIFSNGKSLYDHCAKIHLPRDLQCPRCDKLFKNRGQCRRHLAMHSGYKPYKCNICEYSSYTLSNTQVHVSKTHNQQDVDENITTNEKELDQMNKDIMVDLNEICKNRVDKRLIRKHKPKDKNNVVTGNNGKIA